MRDRTVLNRGFLSVGQKSPIRSLLYNDGTERIMGMIRALGGTDNGNPMFNPLIVDQLQMLLTCSQD
jgi:hypothetical protein